ncbi:MAG: hypothetical protein KDD50_15250, partial [Bdellovibrionales bacterium]|nr:hypothetical protein [Bdellovibrionales bacterium]
MLRSLFIGLALILAFLFIQINSSYAAITCLQNFRLNQDSIYTISPSYQRYLDYARGLKDRDLYHKFLPVELIKPWLEQLPKNAQKQMSELSDARIEIQNHPDKYYQEYTPLVVALIDKAIQLATQLDLQSQIALAKKSICKKQYVELGHLNTQVLNFYKDFFLQDFTFGRYTTSLLRTYLDYKSGFFSKEFESIIHDLSLEINLDAFDPSTRQAMENPLMTPLFSHSAPNIRSTNFLMAFNLIPAQTAMTISSYDGMWGRSVYNLRHDYAHRIAIVDRIIDILYDSMSEGTVIKMNSNLPQALLTSEGIAAIQEYQQASLYVLEKIESLPLKQRALYHDIWFIVVHEAATPLLKVFIKQELQPLDLSQLPPDLIEYGGDQNQALLNDVLNEKKIGAVAYETLKSASNKDWALALNQIFIWL